LVPNESVWAAWVVSYHGGEKEVMEIYGLSHLDGAQPVYGPHRTHASESVYQADTWLGVDELDISPEADMVSRVRDLPDVRTDRIAEVRAQIATGVYETDAKLDIAVGRLLDEIR
jgi:negative regulator of flagellin synthesis FlgM